MGKFKLYLAKTLLVILAAYAFGAPWWSAFVIGLGPYALTAAANLMKKSPGTPWWLKDDFLIPLSALPCSGIWFSFGTFATLRLLSLALWLARNDRKQA